MNLDIRSAKKNELETMDALMQSYLAEFNEFDEVERDEDGRFVYPYLPHYWEDPNRYPFLFRVNNEIVGFALVRFLVDPLNGREMLEMAEFYIVPSHRRGGIGTEAARRLWHLFPGRWRVEVMKSNKNAYPFWKGAISDYTETSYTEQPPERPVGGNYVFLFDSGGDVDVPDDFDPVDY